MENMEKVVYLDNAATTPCAPEALEMMVKALSGACGNPSSHYSVGYEAKEFVDTGRAQVAKAINASPAELFFTSCGSEADNWAVKGTAFTKARQNKKHLITSAFEHHAIMHSMAALERMGFEVTYIKPTAEGYIRPEDVDIVDEADGNLLLAWMPLHDELWTSYKAAVSEAVAEAFGVLKLMHGDFRTGVTCAGNFGRDADTIGAICGAILGAKYGYHTIPPVWAEKPRYPTGTCLLFTKGMDIRAVADQLTDVAISLG